MLSIENGTVTLISEDVINTDSGGNFVLRGALGYLYAEQELNEVCKIYGYGYGADKSQVTTYSYGGPTDRELTGQITGSGARSIRVEDINKYAGITEDENGIPRFSDGTAVDSIYGSTTNPTVNVYYPTITKEDGKSTSAGVKNLKFTSYGYDRSKVNQEIQNIDIGCYQNNGDVDFDIDYFGDTGPIFCLRQLQEEKQESQEKIKQELQYIQSMDSETCESLKNILDNNLDAAMAAEKGFPLYLILNCIRDGSFNLDVANAFEYIYSSLEEDDLSPLDSNYINNLIKKS